MEGRSQRLIKTFNVSYEYEKLRLRIYKSGPYLVVERGTIVAPRREGEVCFIEIFAGTRDEIEQLVVNDPEPHFGVRGAEFLSGYHPEPVSPLRADEAPVDSGSLHGVTSYADLICAVREIIVPAGVSGFFAMYVSVDPIGQQPRKYVCVSGGSAGLLHTYVQKRWFAIDPFLLHGKQSDAPIYSSTVGMIENLSGSWLEMGVAGRSAGLCSWGEFPTHRRGSNDFGVLYVATPILPFEGANALSKKTLCICTVLRPRFLTGSSECVARKYCATIVLKLPIFWFCRPSCREIQPATLLRFLGYQARRV